MFSGLPVAVAFVTGSDLVVQFANERYLALVGCAELAGRSLPAAVPELGGQDFVGLFRQVLESGEPASRHELTVWTGRRRGRPEGVFVDALYHPVRDDSGAVAGVLFFGADVTAQVLGRHKNRELAPVKDRYQALFETLPFGLIRYSAEGLILEANPAASQLTGLPPEEMLTWPLPSAARAVREDGTPLADGELPLETALRTGDVVADMVIGLPGEGTGGPRWLKVTAVPYWPDEAGRPQRGYVMFRDVTEQRRLDRALRGTADTMGRLRDANVLGVVSFEGTRIVRANDAYLDMLGYTREDIAAGRLDWQTLTPPEWAAAMDDAAAQLRRTGAFRPFEKESIHRDGHRVPVLVVGAVTGRDALHWTGYVVDLSARKRAEHERIAAAARERAAQAEARVAREQLSFLIRAGELVSVATDRDELLSRAARLVVPGLADLCVTFLPGEDGMLRATSVAYPGPAGQVTVTDLREFRIPRTGPLLVQAAWETGRTIVKDSTAKRAGFGSPLQEIVDRVDPRSVLAVPLISEGRPLGVITLGRTASRPSFAGGSEIPVAEDLGRQLAMGLANADMSAWDHAVARALQRAVLPDALPRIAGLDLAARYLPSTVGLDVGGDWYDVLALGDGRVGLAVGDVVGHNLAAASVMGQVRNLLRGYAVDKDDPAAVLTATDAAVERLLPDALATAVYAVLDLPSGQLAYTSAGHPPPVCVTPSGEVSYLDGDPDAMLGLGAGFTTRHRPLAPGSTLLFYTDGLIEDRHRDLGDGLARLASAMRLGGNRTAEQTCAAVQAAMVGTAPRADDLCLLAVRLPDSRPPA